MNWNGQREKLQHAIKIASDPANRAIYQAEFNAGRRRLVEQSLLTRPVFIPLRFDLNAAGQDPAYRETTAMLEYDTVIVGIKSDTQTRNIVLKYTENEQSLLRTGNDFNTFLRVDDIAGQTVTNGGGQIGTFYLPSPVFLEARRRFTIEMYKTDTTGTAEEANIVLIGLRVLTKEHAASLIRQDESALIDELIALRAVPQIRLLKVPVTFSTALAGGIDEDIYTPAVEEPLLVRGIRTTLRQSRIEIGFRGDDLWTYEETPIWAVAGEDEIGHENYQWFPKPVYLHADRQIYIRRITNGIGPTGIENIDTQTDNTITFLCETV